MSALQNLGKLIPSSVKDAAGRVSSSRIQSYSLLILIWLVVLIFLGMEITRAIKSNSWEVSTTMEQVFFALLAHHVAMLGVTKNAKSEPRGDLFKDKTSNIESSNDPKDIGAKIDNKDKDIEDLI